MSDPLMEKMLGLPEFEVTDFKAQYVGKQRSAPKVVGSGLWCLRHHALSEFLPKEIKLIGK